MHTSPQSARHTLQGIVKEYAYFIYSPYTLHTCTFYFNHFIHSLYPAFIQFLYYIHTIYLALFIPYLNHFCQLFSQPLYTLSLSTLLLCFLLSLYYIYLLISSCHPLCAMYLCSIHIYTLSLPHLYLIFILNLYSFYTPFLYHLSIHSSQPIQTVSIYSLYTTLSVLLLYTFSKDSVSDTLSVHTFYVCLISILSLNTFFIPSLQHIFTVSIPSAYPIYSPAVYFLYPLSFPLSPPSTLLSVICFNFSCKLAAFFALCCGNTQLFASTGYKFIACHTSLRPASGRPLPLGAAHPLTFCIFTNAKRARKFVALHKFLLDFVESGEWRVQSGCQLDSNWSSLCRRSSNQVFTVCCVLQQLPLLQLLLNNAFNFAASCGS